MRRRDERGYVVVYVIATLALLAIVPMCIAGIEKVGLAFNVTLMLSVGLFWFEARRDPHAFCQYMLVVASGGVVALGTAMILGLGNGWALFKLLIALCVLAGGAAYRLFGSRQREDDIPNLLLATVPKQAIVERNGVQWAAGSELSEFSKTGFGTFRLIFQSCVDAPRRVSVEFYLGNKPIAGSVRLRAGLPDAFELKGAEVVSVTIPIASLGKGSEVEVRVEPTIGGSGGKRIRSFRARAAAHRRSLGERAALVAIGVITWGGGHRVRLQLPARMGRPVDEVLTAEKETLFAL